MLVRMLGPFEVSGPEGAAVVVAGRSQRTVLALLALHAGRPVGVHALTDALWPDGAPASARNSLQSHVARLRAALGAPGVILLSPAGYCLAVGREQVDVLRFEDLVRAGALGEALDLWRGTPLPEFDGEPFRGVAERLAGLRREALADLVDAGGAVDRLWDAAADDPCWERGATVLATSLAHGGRRGEALEVLRRHADAVVDRLGLDPSEAVRLLQVAILRGDAPAPVVGTPDSGWSPGPVRKRSVPLRFSSFLGREGEQSRLAGLLAEPGLVTVTGPGGVGKTRLVAETVRAGSRVAWVDAADVSAADFLAAVATGVGARIGPLDDALEVIGRHAAGFTVVVLDNCEHVVEPAAAVVEAMRGVRVVVTSQERLRVDGERLLALGPLDQPAALRLFADRAGVSTGDPVIVERLDRLPLAIELAATQAAALGVDELRERLDDRLDLLVRGGRTSTARHRTLRAVVEWSFGLLDPSSRRVLTRLSAFAGSFTVAQAEAVVAAEGVAAVLAALVDRSLVVRHGPGRFRLLETIRGYASSLLGDDRDALYRRHADVMLAAARRLDRAFRGPSQAEAVRELDALLPDLRLAVLRSDRAGDLAAALYRYGYRCQQYEVLAWGRSAGDQPDAWAAAATHAWGRGDLAEARALADGFESDAIHEVLGDVALVSCDATTALRHYRAMGTEPVHRVSGLVGPGDRGRRGGRGRRGPRVVDRQPGRAGRSAVRPGRGAGRHRPRPRPHPAGRGGSPGGDGRRAALPGRGRDGGGGHRQPARRPGGRAVRVPRGPGHVAAGGQRHAAGRGAAQPGRAAGAGGRGRDGRAGRRRAAAGRRLSGRTGPSRPGPGGRGGAARSRSGSGAAAARGAPLPGSGSRRSVIGHRRCAVPDGRIGELWSPPGHDRRAGRDRRARRRYR
ncbi:BTAD domain-containing putative transcriptional regulator [Actinoplanes sp. Pm04-4]|uniref:BTAD domain-containing putative transcriptional regulator n=1 Tax=Paractinoplanes pyxinae TaxID=2997416 RepID=A0ABT4B012_9ACTN|nr:BTAD domain-containing putative transcriptional regulator [Actinoplanes pyxinae]MCY1139836.1 BTAD domain-containing putative transcriptional regulator [Actinoplanes pyxinae]